MRRGHDGGPAGVVVVVGLEVELIKLGGMTLKIVVALAQLHGLSLSGGDLGTLLQTLTVTFGIARHKITLNAAP